MTPPPCPTPPTPVSAPRWLAVAIVLAWLAPASLGDAVKLSGFWIEDIIFERIEDGKVVYVGPNGNVIEAELSGLEGLKLDDYPRLSQGLAEAEAGDTAKAIQSLQAVRDQAAEAWLKHFAQWKLLSLYDQASDGLNAVRTYLALIEEGAPRAYLDNPPINAAATIPPDQAAAAVESLNRARNAARNQRVIEHLDTLIEMVQLQGAGDGGREGDAPADEADGAGVTVPRDAILLPEDAPDSSTVALIRQGRLDRALASVNRDVQEVGGLSENLFFKGLIERAIADASEADEQTRQALYKDAGLTFMRIVIHFPRSRYAPLATLEAGYIHEQLGQPEVATRLYAEAEASITQDDYPRYHARLLELTADKTRTSEP